LLHEHVQIISKIAADLYFTILPYTAYSFD